MSDANNSDKGEYNNYNDNECYGGGGGDSGGYSGGGGDSGGGGGGGD